MGTKKKYFLYVGIIIAILLFTSVAVILIKKKHDSVAFSINGQNYSKTYYNNLITEAESHKISSTDAKKQIININKNKHVAAKLNISVSGEQTYAGAKKQFILSPDAKLNDYESLLGWENAYQDQLSFIQKGGVEGFVFFYPFDQLFISPPFNESPTPKGFGDPVKIAELKAYALTQATNDRDQLIAKKTNDSDVINRLYKDPKLVYTNAANDSFPFRILNEEVNLKKISIPTGATLPDYILNQIKSLNSVPGFTNIATQTTDFIASMRAPGVTNPVSEAYYFVHVVNFQKNNPDILNQIDATLKSLKVEIHV